MLKIVYGKSGTPVSDFDVENWVDFNIENYLNSHFPDKVVNTSNELVLITFALRVLEGLIPIFDIKFYFENEEIEFDETLGLQNPAGKAIGIFSSITERSLNQSYLKIKANKKECYKG